MLNAVSKGVVAAVLFVALAFAPAPVLAESSLEPREGWRVIETDHAFADLTERLGTAIEDEGMIRLYVASASRGAAGRGITIPGNMVMGVYRNDFAVRMLEASIAAGMEAPIEFYVTEDPDGGATLSYKLPSFVFAPYMDEGGTALQDMAAELDGIFAAIADRATAD
ncbi:MAG: DUF302 domain-containing protein [Pseudomonadota bacterium]